MPTCKLKIGDLECPFKATAGDEVTLEVKDVEGTVAFRVAEYPSGTPLPGTPSRTIKFTVLAGKNELVVQYVFSDATNGKGALHEVCDGNPKLRDVDAAEPNNSYRICG